MTSTPPTPYVVDSQMALYGWMWTLDNGAEFAVFPGVLPGPAEVTWVESSDTAPTLPKDRKRLGPLYRLTITGQTSLDTTTHRLAVALPDASSNWLRNVWLYDVATASWTSLDSKYNARTRKWQAGFSTLDGYLTILEDRTTQEGIASWYCRLHCSSRYPKLHGTSNDFPIGSYVTVTSTETGKRVKVKIISRWGQPAGRVVDLSWAAYDTLKTKNRGLTKVRVSSVQSSTTTPVPTTETIPVLTVTPTGNGTLPNVSAPSYLVFDAGSGVTLSERKADVERPIASLTKLMTAVVYLDTKPNIHDKFTYHLGDGTGSDASGRPYGYNNLRLVAGDVVTERDLLYATLVGSANNGATALVRASGLSRSQFVAKMNAKAKAWGLTSTHFVEPSGLDPANVSTATDIARLTAKALHGYQPIRYITTRTAYQFRASKSGLHSIKSTDKLLTTVNGLSITGGKTGYLDESLYTYALRVKNAQGAQVVVVVLGSSTSDKRFSEASSLASWAWKAYRWQ